MNDSEASDFPDGVNPVETQAADHAATGAADGQEPLAGTRVPASRRAAARGAPCARLSSAVLPRSGLAAVLCTAEQTFPSGFIHNLRIEHQPAALGPGN